MGVAAGEHHIEPVPRQGPAEDGAERVLRPSPAAVPSQDDRNGAAKIGGVAMPDTTRRGWVRAVASCVALLAAACGGGSDDARAVAPSVTSQVVSDPTTQDIHVFAPSDARAAPVVLALHGIDGSGQDMGAFATRLARGGAVVFAPTYRSDVTTEAGLGAAGQDLACGYQFARTTASRHGGDITQPVTAVGWSLGADLAVLGGLSEPSPDDPCPGGAAPPDIVVGMSGCYYENQGRPVTWFDDVSSLGNKDADVYLIAGERDATCPAWQSQRLSDALRDAGFQVHLVQLPGADHYAPVFHEVRDGRFRVVADDAAGQQAVQVVLDAIASRQGDGGVRVAQLQVIGSIRGPEM
jgi:dienelactone hydrolase